MFRLFCFQMSMEGVRMLAKALEHSGSRGVAHVYVHSEGRIDALGRKREKDARQASQVVAPVNACRTHDESWLELGERMDESPTRRTV